MYLMKLYAFSCFFKISVQAFYKYFTIKKHCQADSAPHFMQLAAILQAL